MLSMRGLERLVAIVDEGSMTMAAAVLHMTQPALSHQIAAIERELGTPVIERLPRGIRPTAAGLVAVAEARIALAAVSKVVTAALAAAGMGVAIVPASAQTPWPDATVRSFDPPELRDVIVVVAAPHDALVQRFVADLKQRGLPLPRLAPLAAEPAVSAS